MSLFMSLDCPHCLTSRASHTVRSMVPHAKLPNMSPGLFEVDVSGTCGACGRMSLACFHIVATHVPTLDHLAGDLTNSTHSRTARDSHFESTLIWQKPDLPVPEAPEHLPQPVERAFLDAEKALAKGIWSLAAAGYRKAVDRAITPLIGDDAKGKMLGPKIGMLERTGLLPPAMLDWIRIVKDDGNFALHDDDRDFDDRDDVERAREFAFTLLTYLYTLPEKVRIARGHNAAP